MIFEFIFEFRFLLKFYVFWFCRNVYIVIRIIRSNFVGYVWFLRGDLSDILENVNRDLVMGCLEKVVKDKRVLCMISLVFRKFMKFGFEFGDNWGKRKKGGEKRRKVLNSNESKFDFYWFRIFFDFVSEEAIKVFNYGYCGIFSFLLVNICLNELDYMMEEKIIEFYRLFMFDLVWKNSIYNGCYNFFWFEFVFFNGKEKIKKMDYIRYGVYFLIGIRGFRENAVEIKEEVICFCGSKLGIIIDNLKMEIEYVSRGI